MNIYVGYISTPTEMLTKEWLYRQAYDVVGEELEFSNRFSINNTFPTQAYDTLLKMLFDDSLIEDYGEHSTITIPSTYFSKIKISISDIKNKSCFHYDDISDFYRTKRISINFYVSITDAGDKTFTDKMKIITETTRWLSQDVMHRIIRELDRHTHDIIETQNKINFCIGIYNKLVDKYRDTYNIKLVNITEEDLMKNPRKNINSWDILRFKLRKKIDNLLKCI
jgi:hypothetical protein